jgi:hypothetical protein
MGKRALIVRMDLRLVVNDMRLQRFAALAGPRLTYIMAD